MTLVDHALMLAERGLAVFPLKPRDKVPATKHGFKDATTDRALIQAHWEGWPEQNIGIATGELSGVFVLDVDGEDGEYSLAKLCQKHGPLPATVEAITGKGRHLYFRWADGLGSTAKRLGPGLDTRGNGGYVVAPPSLHPNGRAYRWSVDSSDEFADAPDWLLELLKAPSKPNGSMNGHAENKEHLLPPHILQQVQTAVEQGKRSEHCFRVMCELFELGLSDWTVQAIADGAPFAEKFWSRGDLLEEVTRARSRWALKTHSKTAAAQPRPHWSENTATTRDLQDKSFPDVSWIVPALIPEGVTLIAGRPKIGKSWLALDLALGVAGNGFVMGGVRVAQGAVLYCAMEDNWRRLQKRIRKLLPDNTEWPARLTMATAWRRLDQGGVEDIAEWLDATQDPKLVILDTLAACRPRRSKNDGAYADDYDALSAIHKLANARGIGVLAAHHVRKMDADDPIDQISGTLGLAGAADTLMVFKKSGTGTSLYGRGRDVEEYERAVEFDAESCKWRITGDVADRDKTTTRKKIVEALQGATSPMSPREVAAIAGLEEKLTWVTLVRMVRDGEVNKEGRGAYSLPTDK